MTNIMDYLTWRGDLPMETVHLCDVDYLVLCRLSYIKMTGILPESFEEEPLTIGEMAREALAREAYTSKDDTGLLVKLIKSRRFQNLKLIGHVDIFDQSEQEQFSAVSILLPDDSVVIAYRGTDKTIIGWKEDFNMGFADYVPAQEDAAEYIETVAKKLPKLPIRVCGHSKGGNLAVYSAAFCREEIQQRILEVRNFDGPGFNEKNISHPGVMRMREKTKTYLPQSSVIGMLLEHEEEFMIVHSNSVGIFQHDLYSWEIKGADFVYEEEITGSSVFIDRTLKQWLGSMTPRMREEFINSVFDLLGECDGKTLRDLWTGKNAIAIAKTLASMDEETRANLIEGLAILKASAGRSLTTILENNAH